ncbi:unnamed protein product, partial [Heterotrigona itama]
ICSSAHFFHSMGFDDLLLIMNFTMTPSMPWNVSSLHLIVSRILRLERLEPRCKFQQALRLKKRRGPAKCHRRGLQQMASHSLNGKFIQSMGNHS